METTCRHFFSKLILGSSHVNYCDFFNFRFNLVISTFLAVVGCLITCTRQQNCPYVKHVFTLDKNFVADHSLHNHVIATLTVSGAVECYNNCRMNCQCNSLNFWSTKNEKNCELNKENKFLKPYDLHPDLGAQYYNLHVIYSVKVRCKFDRGIRERFEGRPKNF